MRKQGLWLRLFAVPTDRHTLFKLAHTGPWEWNYFQGALLLRYWVSCPLWNAPEIDCVCLCKIHTPFFNYYHMTPARQTYNIKIKSKSNKRRRKGELIGAVVAGICCPGLVSVRSGLQRTALAAWNVSLYTVQSCLLPVVKLCLWGLAASTLTGDLLPYLGKSVCTLVGSSNG